MRFTTYGKTLAATEALPEIAETGATAHAKACAYDSGLTILLTGKSASGKRFRREAHSVYGAFAMMAAAWGLERAWHVTDDGKRRLIFER